MTKSLKEYIKVNLPYYTKIDTLRYNSVKGKSWRLLTDYCRLRDFIKYRSCVSCGSFLSQWRDCDGGHYISMGGHGASIGFSDKNVHAQCSKCNLQASQHTGFYYKEELTRRYGEEIHSELEHLKNTSIKADDFFFVKKIEEIYEKFQSLKRESPDYDYPDYLII